MSKIFNSLLEDNSGGLSSNRIVFFAWCIGILIIWGYTSIKNNQIAPLDQSVQVIFGILMGGKIIQRGLEKPETKPEDNQKPEPNPTP